MYRLRYEEWRTERQMFFLVCHALECALPKNGILCTDVCLKRSTGNRLVPMWGP